MIIRFKKLLQHKIDTKAQRIDNIQVRFKQKHIVETIFFLEWPNYKKRTHF